MGLRAVANPLASGALPSNVTSASLNSITPTGGTLAVTGQATFAAGSAAAPSVKIGDEQNGLYSSAANTLSVALGGVESFRFGYVASAVNYATITGSATGNAVAYGVAGTDTDIGLKYATKGTGDHSFLTNGSTEQFRIVHVANAANYWSVFGKATGGSPTFYAGGSDSLVNASYSLKGGGSHIFYTGTSSVVQLIVDHVASTVNRPVISGSATGNAVTISAQGSDSNIDFAITPKGTGNVRFGTHSAIAAETVTGYITIKDSAGNTRKLAVVS